MKKNKKNFIKKVGIAVAVLFIISGVALAILIYQITAYYSDSGVYGDVVLLNEGEVHVGDTIPMVFAVPEEFADLHKEMWDCYRVQKDEFEPAYEYVMDHHQIEDFYSDDEILHMFKDSTIDITYSRNENSHYSSKIAVFKPEEPGTYYIEIMGYYRSTSPQSYGGIEIKVEE